MKYFKLYYYTEGGDYETQEMLMDEIKFRKLQKAVLDGNDFIVLDERVIKRSQIREMSPADDIIREYTNGLSVREKAEKLKSMKLAGSPDRIGIREEDGQGRIAGFNYGTIKSFPGQD